MKHLLLFALLLPFNIKAQQTAPANHIGKKTTSTPLRLLASTYLRWSGTGYYISDSSVYTYSDSRAFNFDARGFNYYNKFDSSLIYSFDTTAHSYSNYYKMLLLFDAFSNVQTQTYQSWNTVSATWQITGYYQSLFTYDGANRILTEIGQVWDPSTLTWTNQTQMVYTYDVSGNLIVRLRKDWNASASTWQILVRDTYTYDASGNMLTDVTESDYGGWTNYSKHIYGYTGSNLIADQTQMWSDSGTWDNSSIILYSGYTAGIPQVKLSQSWDNSTSNYYNVSKTTYSYNSYGQPDFSYNQDWNSFTGSWENKTKTHYYYAFPEAVGGVLANKNAISIYPIPAANTLNVVVEWTEPQPFTVSIYDIAGKLYHSWDIPSCAKHTQAIPVSDLVPGNYIIRLHGPHSSESRQITIK